MLENSIKRLIKTFLVNNNILKQIDVNKWSYEEQINRLTKSIIEELYKDLKPSNEQSEWNESW